MTNFDSKGTSRNQTYRIANDLQYQIIAARRQQFDNLLWQVPTLGMTAQAFLFSTAFTASDVIARILSSLLAIVFAIMCILLMARHRQSEINDSHLIEEYERLTFGAESALHGKSYPNLRDSQENIRSALAWIPTAPGYKTWIIGLLIFAGVGIVAFLRAVLVLYHL